MMDENEANMHKPIAVLVDDANNIDEVRDYI